MAIIPINLMNPPTYYTSHAPIVFSAIGSKGSGRMTTMIFLGELLWELGYRNLKATDTLESNLIEKYSEYTNLPIGCKSFDKPIIIIGRCESKKDAEFLSTFPHAILIKLERSEQPSQSLSSVKRLYTDQDCWIHSPDNTFKNNLYSLHNDGSFRMLKFQLRDLFINEISKSEKWKKCYGPTA